jgi:hypothetical protein
LKLFCLIGLEHFIRQVDELEHYMAHLKINLKVTIATCCQQRKNIRIVPLNPLFTKMEYEIQYLCETSMVELLCFSFSSPVAIIFCCSYYFFFRPILNLVNLEKEICFPLKVKKMIKQVSNPLYIIWVHSTLYNRIGK